MYCLMKDLIYDTLYIVPEYESYSIVNEFRILGIECTDVIVYQGTKEECIEIMRGEE